MKEAIKKAIEGGYKKLYGYEDYKESDDTLCMAGEFGKVSNHFLLDPLFWQALGKAEGWIDGDKDSYGVPKEKWGWKDQWHRFIDKIADGGTPDEFFKDLLTLPL